MMTWKSVDLPEPVLPAKSACWRVPLPMARYWCLVAPVRPMAFEFAGGVVGPHLRSLGATCAKGTSTRFESMLACPIFWMNSIASSALGGGIEEKPTPVVGLPVMRILAPSD